MEEELPCKEPRSKQKTNHAFFFFSILSLSCHWRSRRNEEFVVAMLAQTPNSLYPGLPSAMD
jgi:hypothetical protein